MPSLEKSIVDGLWAEPDERVYMVFDGASCPGLVPALYEQHNPRFECLYRGELTPDMAQVAPYIAQLEPDTPFATWALSGWGAHWGILAVAALPFNQMRLHFRKLNVVNGPDGNPLLFRYYDPRALRVVAPTCNVAQLRELFGPVRRYLIEPAESAATSLGRATTLALADGKLVMR